MSIEMDEEIERWTARRLRASALFQDIIQGKTTIGYVSPAEFESMAATV